MEKRVTVKAPAILLGVPIPESENPYLAAPTGSVTYKISVSDCREPGLESKGVNRGVDKSLADLWRNTLQGMGLSACAKLELIEAQGTPTRAGLYASASIALLHTLSRYYGETLSTMELVELARYGDPHYAGSWGYVLDALRYSAAEGALSVYRNDEEHYTIARGHVVQARVLDLIEVGEPRVGRESLGSDVYSALIHTIGVTVLEASLRLNEGAQLLKVLEELAPVHEGIMYAVWGVLAPRGCVPSPGIPGQVEVLCLDSSEHGYRNQ